MNGPPGKVFKFINHDPRICHVKVFPTSLLNLWLLLTISKTSTKEEEGGALSQVFPQAHQEAHQQQGGMAKANFKIHTKGQALYNIIAEL
eukprot:554502-Rhodomonas_salina.1